MAEVKSTLSPGGDQGTPDPGGAYYVSIAAWESTIQNTNWPAAGDTPVIECYGGDYGGLDGALN